MDQFEFEADLDVLNDRAVFANRIFKLLWQKHGGDIDEAIAEAESFFDDLERYVRNIYEIKDTEIPLWSYAYLLEHGADAWSFSEDEYQDAIESAREACEYYYGGDYEF